MTLPHEFPEPGEALSLADGLTDMMAGAPLDCATLRRAANALRAVAYQPPVRVSPSPPEPAGDWTEGDGGPDPLSGPPSLESFEAGDPAGRQQVDCP